MVSSSEILDVCIYMNIKLNYLAVEMVNARHTTKCKVAYAWPSSQLNRRVQFVNAKKVIHISLRSPRHDRSANKFHIQYKIRYVTVSNSSADLSSPAIKSNYLDRGYVVCVEIARCLRTDRLPTAMQSLQSADCEGNLFPAAGGLQTRAGQYRIKPDTTGPQTTQNGVWMYTAATRLLAVL